MTIELTQIGRFETGIFDESAAEINTYDPISKRLFVVNGDSNAIDVLDLSDPSNPNKIGELDFSQFGGGPNSVAVKNGIVVVAVEDDNTQDSGKAIFFDVDGNVLNTVTVGSLPDMVTFTPDGTKVLVANEGEPNDDYTVDPEGSVSIIDISQGVANATVTTADFSGFNDQIDALRASGLRVFGPNATVAQDVEPEYITVSSDSTQAWISLQENNALAVLDINSGQITDILPLGTKDHSTAPTLETFFFDQESLPVIGNTESRGDIRLSGFSGLYFEGINPDNGNLQFVTHPDRGPDDGRDADGNRIFLLPELQPQLVRFELDQSTGALEITERIGLKRPNGDPLTGLPNLEGLDPDTPVDPDGNLLDFDPLGADLEGVVRASDGTYWTVDEYRPSLYHFEADGTLIKRYVPEGLPAEVGTGVFPEVYNTRRPNRGFEAIAYQDDKVYAFIQTPINNPSSQDSATIRILEFDPATETTIGEYLYIQEDMGGGSDKIGDAVALAKTGEFLVIERDSGFGSDSVKNIFRINIANATNLAELPDDILAAGETFESLTPEQLAAKGIETVSKEVYADLAELGYGFTDKPEGLAMIDETTFAVLNDNDFGENPTIPIGLGIVQTQNGLDASDRDGAINIRNWPVSGLYQPDAIDSFEVNGQTYIVTANEGDARDYDGFSEEERIKDLELDPTAFPNADALQEDDALGRLTVTNTLGDTDGDGDFDELYAFGSRSFSIWDSQGNLVFDSGDQFEQITAQLFPDFFNSDNDENSFDTRSDNKGPEPEGVVVGAVNDRTYAFVGLERVGGIMVYDITDPANSSFVQYINNRDFSGDAEAGTAGDLGPEGLTFISEADSPNGVPLLVVSNEVSGSTTVYEIGVQVPEDAILGTAGDDSLNGTVGDDFIEGLGGNDQIFGSEGVNTLSGGAGNDTIYGGSQDDLIYGGVGNDTIYASEGNNKVFGNAGDDTIYSGSGDDYIAGGAGDDTIWLSGGQDTVVLAKGEGSDTINNFQLGQTSIGLMGGLTFEDLMINQGNGATLISAGDELLASINWVQASDINSDVFVTV